MPPRRLRPRQRAELYVVNIAAGESTFVTGSSTLLFEAPNWTPDGQSLVVNGDGLLFRVPVGGGDLRQVPLGDIPPINNDHVLSPDGPRCTCRRTMATSTKSHSPVASRGGSPTITGRRSTITNVYTIHTAGGEDVQLTDDEFPDDGSGVQPDGFQIYFNSERGSSMPGHAQLFPHGTGRPPS